MPKPIQAPEQFQDVIFPARGLDVSVEREEQPPLTSVLGLNVRNFEPITFRGRGGIRSGLNKYINGKVNGTALIQHIQIIVDPQASALGDSFVDGVAGWDILIPDSITPYILADGSYDTTGPNGSGYHTNKKKKRKHPQLIIKAKNQTKTQGDEFTWNGSEYTITHGSLLSGDTIKSVSFRSDGADKDAANGNYDIIASNAVFQLSNAPGYEVVYQKGKMTVGSGFMFAEDNNSVNNMSSSPVSIGDVFSDVVTDDLIVIAVVIAGDASSSLLTITGVTDNLGNTYQKAGTTVNGTYVNNDIFANKKSTTQIWWTVSGANGSLDISVLGNPGQGQFYSYFMLFTGGSPTANVRATSTGSGSYTSPTPVSWSAGTVASQTGDLVVATFVPTLELGLGSSFASDGSFVTGPDFQKLTPTEYLSSASGSTSPAPLVTPYGLSNQASGTYGGLAVAFQAS